MLSTRQDTRRGLHAIKETGTLQDAVTEGILTPLAALRASLESLGSDLTDRRHHGLIEEAIAGIGRIGRNAEALYEYCVPEPMQPLRCSLDEITRGAYDALQPSLRSHVWLASEQSSESLVVDGPRLIHCLVAFLEQAASRTAHEVLLHAHGDDSVVYFAIVDDIADPASLIEGSDESHLASENIELALARRDIARMGGSIAFHHATPDHHCVVVRLPRDAGEGGAE